jgi:hypothetical protein
MTATLAQDLNIVIRGQPAYERMLPLDTSAAQVVYKGMAMIIDNSQDTLNIAIADGITVTTSDVFIGISAGYYSVAISDPETTYPQIITWPSIVGFQSTALTNASIGQAVYASAYTATGVTLSTSVGAYPRLGLLWLVENGYAFILIDPPTKVLAVS